MDSTISNVSNVKKAILLSSFLHASSVDQYGEQSGRRQAQRPTGTQFSRGDRFRSRIKRLARTARQRNRGLWKRTRNMFRQTYRLTQKRYLKQCRHNFGRKFDRPEPVDTLYYKAKV
jgi:hypothetical protein